MVELTETEKLEYQTRKYSVLVTNGTTGNQGSGLLFYPGSEDRLYVFTCAHVVDQAEEVQASFLLPKMAEQNDYDVCHLTAPKEQIIFSPLDIKTDGESGQFQHTHDIAVIVFHKDIGLHLDCTAYCLSEAEDYMPLYVQGYPGGCRDGEEILFALDRAVGKVKAAVPKSPFFEFRVEDGFLDTGDRELELRGFSGSPVWDSTDQEHSVVGLMSAGKRENVFRSLVKAVKMRYVQSIMKNRFGIIMETKLPWIPEEDVADRGELRYDGTLPPMEDRGTVQDIWLTEQQQRIRALVDELKLGTAIDLCQELMEDTRFPVCSKENKLLFLKHLMYCYDTCLLEHESSALEQYMRQEGLIEEHDTGRWLTKLFMSQRYEELLHFAEEIPKEDKDYPLAEFLGTMAKAFVLKIGPEETVGLYVDAQERLREPAKDLATESLYLQIIGYVYDIFYHMPEKAIRCLNRSYRINNQPIICEALAGAYYHLAIRDALNEENRIIIERIDYENLYKARQCFLIIIEQEDELCFKGAIKRMGWEIFHTFAFLNDFYRILTLYPWMKEEFLFKNDADRRDVEMICANVMIQGGSIDLSQFSALTDEDCLMFQTGAEINRFMNAWGTGGPPPVPEVAQELDEMITKAENLTAQVNGDAKLTFHRSLILLYSSGFRLFGWNVLDKMRQHYQKILESSNQQLIEDMGNVIFECEHSYEENIQHFQTAFEQTPSMRSWHALLGIHIRAGNLDRAEEMYQDLLSNHKELYQDAPEYAYRDYLDFIRDHHRDLKNALKYFLDGKEQFHDQDIVAFWETELRHFTFNFNEPERYEEERYPFVEKGLIPPEVYYRGALMVYTENLNGLKADEMFQALPESPLRILTWEEVKYLVWREKIEPVNDPDWKGMMLERVSGILEQYAGEVWGDTVTKTKLINRFKINRVCVLDAWTLYLLAVQGKLNQLEQLDTVYVPHIAVDHLLNEISRRANPPAREALNFMNTCSNIYICSPDFSSQLKVREKVFYDEPASVVALALEKECIAIIGDPYTGEALLRTFFADILRPTQIFI